MRRMLDLYVQCDDARPIGKTPDGFLNVIPILGGTVKGDVEGTILPGGADWNYSIGEGVSSVSAKYMFQSKEGVLIGIENSGMLEAQEQGEQDRHIITKTRFWVDMESPYKYLNYGVYVGSLSVEDDIIHVTIYDVNAEDH